MNSKVLEKQMIRLREIDGSTYDVELVETKRTRVFPEDEVREILAEAIHKGYLDMQENPIKYERLFNIYGVIARNALEDIKARFNLSISLKRKG